MYACWAPGSLQPQKTLKRGPQSSGICGSRKTSLLICWLNYHDFILVMYNNGL